MGPIQTLDDIRDMMRRRAGVMLLICVLGAVASVLFALSQPHHYLSSEVIQIERPKITDGLAPSTVEGSTARRLQLIQQQLMARDTILEIIEKHGLFANQSELEKVALFRQSVTIEGVAAAREGMSDDGSISALTITALLGSPEKAQAVARELGARTIDLSAEARRAKTRATLDFFNREETALVEAIAALETEIAAFRSKNELSITGGIEFRQVEIGAVNQAILDVEQGRITIQRELERISAGTQRPATQRRMNELQAQLQSFDEQRAFLVQRLAELQRTLSGSPEIERRVAIFEMRLEQYQEQLEAVSARRADAEIGHRLESNRQAERLEVLEPASLPEYPVPPSRKKIAALGTLAAIGAAFGFAFLLELRNPVIRSGAQLTRELGYAAAICIPAQPPVRRPRFQGVRRRIQRARMQIAAMRSRIRNVRDAAFARAPGTRALGTTAPARASQPMGFAKIAQARQKWAGNRPELWLE